MTAVIDNRHMATVSEAKIRTLGAMVNTAIFQLSYTGCSELFRDATSINIVSKLNGCMSSKQAASTHPAVERTLNSFRGNASSGMDR